MDRSKHQPQSENELVLGTEQNRHFSFMTLPAELRNQIYECVVIDTGAYMQRLKPGKLTSPTALYLVSKQVHQEYESILYKKAPVITAGATHFDFQPLMESLQKLLDETQPGFFDDASIHREINVRLQLRISWNPQLWERGIEAWLHFLEGQRSTAASSHKGRLNLTYRAESITRHRPRPDNVYELLGIQCFVGFNVANLEPKMDLQPGTAEDELSKICRAVNHIDVQEPRPCWIWMEDEDDKTYAKVEDLED